MTGAAGGGRLRVNRWIKDLTEVPRLKSVCHISTGFLIANHCIVLSRDFKKWLRIRNLKLEIGAGVSVERSSIGNKCLADRFAQDTRFKIVSGRKNTSISQENPKMGTKLTGAQEKGETYDRQKGQWTGTTAFSPDFGSIPVSCAQNSANISRFANLVQEGSKWKASMTKSIAERHHRAWRCHNLNRNLQ